MKLYEYEVNVQKKKKPTLLFLKLLLTGVFENHVLIYILLFLL